MKLAFSSLAWNPLHDVEVAAILRSAGFGGVELAPTKLWPDLMNVSASDISGAREFWKYEGLPIIATQAILFGRNDLQLFGTPDQQKNFEEFLIAAIELSASLGADVVVLGAPGNRKRGTLSVGDANEVAVPILRRIGDSAAPCGVALAIEPNPIEYGCDWIVNAEEGRDLVAQVGSPGFKLHLDAAALSMSSASASTEIEKSIEVLHHFHISERDLRPIGESGVAHREMADALERAHYGRWCSVEMREPAALDVIANAAAMAQRLYGESATPER